MEFSRVPFRSGREITAMNAHRIAGLGVSRTYQIPRPFTWMPVLDNVALAAMCGPKGYDREAARGQAWRWLNFTGLGDKVGALPDQLNLHQRKLLELARAPASEPGPRPPARAPGAGARAGPRAEARPPGRGPLGADAGGDGGRAPTHPGDPRPRD